MFSIDLPLSLDLERPFFHPPYGLEWYWNFLENSPQRLRVHPLLIEIQSPPILWISLATGDPHRAFLPILSRLLLHLASVLVLKTHRVYLSPVRLSCLRVDTDSGSIAVHNLLQAEHQTSCRLAVHDADCCNFLDADNFLDAAGRGVGVGHTAVVAVVDIAKVAVEYIVIVVQVQDHTTGDFDHVLRVALKIHFQVHFPKLHLRNLSYDFHLEYNMNVCMNE